MIQVDLAPLEAMSLSRRALLAARPTTTF